MVCLGEVTLTHPVEDIVDSDSLFLYQEWSVVFLRAADLGTRYRQDGILCFASRFDQPEQDSLQLDRGVPESRIRRRNSSV